MNEKLTQETKKISEYLEEHNVKDVTVVDLRDCSWTSAFVIGTVTSVGHLKGVVHQIWSLLNEMGLSVNNRHKTPGDDGWELIDCGDIVIHLMSPDLREFYSLEKLWKATEDMK